MKLTINIDTALEALHKNLEEHIVELKEVVPEWTNQCIAELEKFRDAVTRKGLDASLDELYKLSYQRPKDTRKQYSKFIGALERAKAAGGDKFEIDEDDYDCIFNDNWDWRITSKTANSAYKK